MTREFVVASMAKGTLYRAALGLPYADALIKWRGYPCNRTSPAQDLRPEDVTERPILASNWSR